MQSSRHSESAILTLTDCILGIKYHLLSFDANFSSFSLAENPPRDLQINAYK